MRCSEPHKILFKGEGNSNIIFIRYRNKSINVHQITPAFMERLVNQNKDFHPSTFSSLNTTFQLKLA